MSEPKRWRDWIVEVVQEDYKKYLIITHKDIQDVDVKFTQKENN